MAMHRTAFLPAPPFAPPRRPRRSPGWTCRARVPSDATTAAGDITQAVRAALLAGRRRLCVDVLTAAVDARARTFDAAAAATVILALVRAVQPVLPAERPAVRLVVPGPAAALRVNAWLRDAGAEDVSVGVLGVREGGDEEGERDEKGDADADAPQAYVVVDPPAEGDAVLDLRKLLRLAHKRRVPVIVHNHPRQDTLYAMLGYAGHIPFELTKFEPAFVLAPFALKPKDKPESPPDPANPPKRFVVMRKFPDKWALWRFLGEDANLGAHSRPLTGADDPLEMEQLDEYRLCEEFEQRPTDGELLQVISKSLG